MEMSCEARAGSWPHWSVPPDSEARCSYSRIVRDAMGAKGAPEVGGFLGALISPGG